MENTFNRLYLIPLNVRGSGRVLIGQGAHVFRYLRLPEENKLQSLLLFISAYTMEEHIIKTVFAVILIILLKQQLDNYIIMLHFRQLRRRREEEDQ